jgi:hypothetical protein
MHKVQKTIGSQSNNLVAKNVKKISSEGRLAENCWLVWYCDDWEVRTASE